MLKHWLRWLTGLGAAGALVAASATPAVAAAPIAPYFQDTTLAVGSAPTTRGLLLYADEPTTLSNVSVRYDYRSLADKITIDPPRTASGAPPRSRAFSSARSPSTSSSTRLPPLGSGVYRNGAEAGAHRPHRGCAAR